MYIGEIISNFYAEVAPSDTVDQALDRINEFHFHQLPLVDEGKFVGLLREEDLLAVEDGSLTVSHLRTAPPVVYLYDHQHIYDALQMMGVHKHDILPVIDKNHDYQGIITQKGVLEALNHAIANDEAGAIIVLEMDIKDYALSQIAHIIESENTRILSMATHQVPDANRIGMTIKVNKNHISPIVASLRRFNFVVKATFNDGSDHNDIQERYGLLMHYLDL